MSVARPAGPAADAASGLTAAEVAERLARDGPNELPRPPGPSRGREFLAQITHFFAVLLWVAAGLALVAGMPQLAVAIAVVVVVNGAFAFAQEFRAERAAAALRDLLPRRATVRRAGTVQVIDASMLVVDDVVLLTAGDRVSADLRALTASALMVDESMLTGESVPVAVEAGDRLSAGTFVVEGEAEAIVVATGNRTRLAEIAALTRSASRPPSPLQRELHRLVRLVAAIALGVGLTFFTIALGVGTPASDGFLFAIGVTVALVPEGLLPTVTLSLAMGAQRMARRHALVRHLDAVETLGATTFICSDKTGTLTRNEMGVVRAWTPSGSATVTGEGYDPAGTVTVDPPTAEADAAIAALALAAARTAGSAVRHDGTRWVPTGDPMDAATAVFAARAGVDVAGDELARPDVHHFPFDPHRRRSSLLVDGEVLVKGAPEAVLPCCTDVPAGAADAVAGLADQGLRVLAYARRTADGVPPADADDAERALTLLGFVGLVDPPRRGAADAIAACRRAGIRVAMITGDHPRTARAIGMQLGLIGPDGMVLNGADLPADEQVLGALVDRDGVVVSRVSPEDKLRIARALRSRGHVVAMTGDGVNDGPALREADIGVAMGASGTDVAREAADLVLLDDDFATIVAAVEQGRATFSNIRRFLTYHLTDNVAELTPFAIWALSGGRFPLALGVLQVLSLDIGTDLLPALALGAEPADESVLDRPIAGRHLLDRGVFRRVFAVLGPVEAAVEMAAFVTGLWLAGWRPGGTFPTGAQLAAASGAAFAAVVLGQMANAFACRSVSRPPWRLRRRNPLLVGAVAVEVLALVVFLGFPPLAGLLGHGWPALGAGLVALAAVPAVLAADTVHKAVRQHRAGDPAVRQHRAGDPAVRQHRAGHPAVRQHGFGHVYRRDEEVP